MIINQNLSGAIRILNPRIQFTQEMILINKKSKLQWGKRKILKSVSKNVLLL